MKLRSISCGVVVALNGICTGSRAQIPFEPPQEEQSAPTSPAEGQPPRQQTPDKQADVDWLTAYMLVNEGYRFDHLPALEQSFEKMTPTQLHTLRHFYEQKQALAMQRAATIRQMQALQIGRGAAYQQRQQQVPIRLPAEPSAVDIGTLRLNQMRAQADANARGDLFRGRTVERYGDDPFGHITGRPVGAADDDAR